MSFSRTTSQMRARTKTVTRRRGWWFLKAGEIICAVEKGQGLKKGEKVVRIGPIRIVSTRAERLRDVTKQDVIKEGFPNMSPNDFVWMFCTHGCGDSVQRVNRIEFEFV